MRIDALVPDAPAALPAAPAAPFAALIAAASDGLERADAAERAFVAHRGGLREMVVERARADIALQIAASGVQRVTQGLQTLFGLQI